MKPRHVSAAEALFRELPDKDDVTEEDIDRVVDYVNHHNTFYRGIPKMREYTTYIGKQMKMYIHHTETDYDGTYDRMRKRDLERYKEALV